MRQGVNVVIADNQNRILVIKRGSSVKFSPNIWDLPGGKVEDNENLIEAAKRETKEESDLDIELEDNYFYIYHYPNEEIDIYAFRARLVNGIVKLDNKHTAFKWVSRNNWRKLNYTPSVEATLAKLF